MTNCRNKRVRTSNLICPDCKKSFPIPRPYNTRERNHIKDVYCPFCGEVKKMREIRYCDYNFNDKEGEQDYE